MILALSFLFVPSVEAAVIVTVFPFPAFFAVTFPWELTVAYFVFELLHFKTLFTVLPAFPSALTAVFSVTFFPAF